MKRSKKSKRAQSNGPAFVEIRIDEVGDAFIPDCGVSRANGDEVRWISDFGPWKVVFPPGNKPFGDAEFYVPAGGASSWSGPPTGTKKKYPYKIKTPTGAKDPNIIIK